MSRKEDYPWFLRRNKFAVKNAVEPEIQIGDHPLWGGDQTKWTLLVDPDTERVWKKHVYDDGWVDADGNFTPPLLPETKKNTYSPYISGKYRHSYDYPYPAYSSGTSPLYNGCRVTRPSTQPTSTVFYVNEPQWSVVNGYVFFTPVTFDVGELGPQTFYNSFASFDFKKEIHRASPCQQHNPQAGVLIQIDLVTIKKTWARSYQIISTTDIYDRPRTQAVWNPKNLPYPYDNHINTTNFKLLTSETFIETLDFPFTTQDNPYPNTERTTNSNIIKKRRFWKSAAGYTYKGGDDYDANDPAEAVGQNVVETYYYYFRVSNVKYLPYAGYA